MRCSMRRVQWSWLALLGVGCVSQAPVDPACPPALGEAVTVCADGPTVTGIDVSYWQGDINWNSVAGTGLTFAIARVTHGLGTIDTKFAANWAGMHNVGLVRGAYQYFDPSEDAIAQADLMLTKIQAAGGLQPDDLPPVLDLEEDNGNTTPSAQIGSRALQWLQHVEAAVGKKPIIYTGAYFITEHQLGGMFSDYPLWVANWGVSCPSIPTGWSRWTFWQHSATQRIAGISGDVDGDKFNGSLQDLRAFAQITASPVDAGLGPSTCKRVRVTTSSLNIRPLPNTSLAPVGTLALDDQVDVLGEAHGATVVNTDLWYFIDNGAGLQGYISAYYAECVAVDVPDAGSALPDASVARDAAAPPDAGPAPDAARPADAGVAVDAAVRVDAGVADAGAADAARGDAATPRDAGNRTDAGRADAGGTVPTGDAGAVEEPADAGALVNGRAMGDGLREQMERPTWSNACGLR